MTHDSYAAVLSIVNLMPCYFLDYTILKLLPDNESFWGKKFELYQPDIRVVREAKVLGSTQFRAFICINVNL